MRITSHNVTAFLALTVLSGLCLVSSAQTQTVGNVPALTEIREISDGLPAAYQKWLDVDVRWIITPQERAEFTRLSKNDDRDRFIDAFWLRRDPTSGTPQNQYKEEHYRRLAYANKHFASDVPGWKTDRGRIYIVYGPPDWVKAQSAADSGNGKPTQLWHYLFISGYGTEVDLRFVDACHCGDYRLQAAPKD